MKFIKYQHVERFGTSEVEGIEAGTCYVSAKIDGSNGSLWLGDDGEIKAGSRNRELTLDQDNQGFLASIQGEERYEKFFNNYPTLRLYGEYMVPHSLKTYKDDAWGKFYVFDVMDDKGKYVRYEEYEHILRRCGIEYIAPIRKIINGNRETFERCLEENKYLIKDGEGVGEGLVIRNFDFVNKYGRVTWAKIVTNEFKEKHVKEMGVPQSEVVSIESRIVDKYVTKAFIEKEYAKLLNETDGWRSKYIPRLLSVIFHTLIVEETWNILKTFKNPKIDFKFLNNLVIMRIKAVLPNIF